ncbi:hypothetical protein QQZ08_012532 [Neonectria magnoliae]|uniref:Uncharacterized protein n=1 Tax=Neonectria magnoliae TaxID=2732573 RepID=A0ABR1H0A6_9HYPO
MSHISGAKAHQSHNVAAHTNVLSVAFYAGKTRVVSGHIHDDGTVDYSKGQGSQAEASSSRSGFETGLTWQVNAANQAEYWDGTQWQHGEWSDEHQLWIAYYNGAWYAWM